ncbi:MAG: hypothetical protein IPP89_06150 [Saprospiraceae bacterium]|nr:hypothetical protein [Candidatus Brachybacter algidus]MBL0118561.1 hypothetical protein [Candidatus Brachybacter algidus]
MSAELKTLQAQAFPGAFEFGDHTAQTPDVKAPSGLYVNIHEAASSIIRLWNWM